MNETNKPEIAANTPETRLEWVEPTHRVLDVRETSINPQRGGDANFPSFKYQDCTRS